MRYLCFILLIISQAFAEDYQVVGSFQTQSPPALAPLMDVGYILRWKEEDKRITGTYKDTFFTVGRPVDVTGRVTKNEREFIADLPAPVLGFMKIKLEIPETKKVRGRVPIVVTTIDTFDESDTQSHKGFAAMAPVPEEQQEVRDVPEGMDACELGFGALAGYCGLYGGKIEEIADPTNRCDLLAIGRPRLQLEDDTDVVFYLNYTPGVPMLKTHPLGSIESAPEEPVMKVSNRFCSALPGTNFIPDNCKIMTLSGTFYERGEDNAAFSGTYVIRDQVTAEACTYNLSFIREAVEDD